MFDYENFKRDVFLITEETFDGKALELFAYQYETNRLYQGYCKQLGRSPGSVGTITDIPFLPIAFFKSHHVQSGHWLPEKTFLSSGTTGSERSRHLVRDVSFYHKVARTMFESLYGPLAAYQILALLPSYQEQGNSSLISMVDHFIQHALPGSQYYLHQPVAIQEALADNTCKKLLIGVSYALLDLSERINVSNEKLLVMETGGMKGRRKELVRAELHEQVKKGIQTEAVHSEYGMTELTSQAYGPNGAFTFPKWARVMVRDVNDPFAYLKPGKTGGINIIDLANIDSCAFIETKDLGQVLENGTFEVLGRFDNSDIRGCNLLI